MKRRTILGVFAHPDDESMGPGASLAKYAGEGHRVLVVTATEGGAGRLFEERPTDEAGRAELRRRRRQETLDACRILGATHLGFLGWEDGKLSTLNPLRVEETLAALLRRERPDVAMTFHGSGISYHPDHRVLTMALTAAALGAARRDWYLEGEAAALPPHRTAKLYGYTVADDPLFREKWPRRVYLSPEDEITTVIDTVERVETKWAAIRAHATQEYGPPFQVLYEGGAFRRETYLRLLPSVRPDEPVETDLLAGLD